MVHFSLLFATTLFIFFCSNPTVVTCSKPAAPDAPFSNDNLRTYIIHVQPPESAVAVAFANSKDLESWYRSFLPETITDSAESRMVHTYGEVFSGFAARLTKAEVEQMKKKDGFVRAYPDRVVPLLTTHTPDFLGLRLGRGLWRTSNLGEGVIIGMLDSGILPTHPSFDDDGMPSPPAKWKGVCEFESGCNNKVIGGKELSIFPSPVDSEGHGTHTASTAAGNFVKPANLFGVANGTAAGMAPRAHLAIYHVCGAGWCKISDILAGLDTGVKDGVDVLSLSLGGRTNRFDEDPIAIGAFGATDKGVIVVCAAGNSGPDPQTLSNEAPWILTVAASTTDRCLRTTVTLGDGQQFYGEAVYQHRNSSSKKLPLYYPTDGACSNFGSVDVKGKVVVCVNGVAGRDRRGQGFVVKEAGGAGMISISKDQEGYTLFVGPHFLPASDVTAKDGSKIISYANSNRDASASITFNGTVLGASPAPVVAFFSSRGPSSTSPGILKPDITGPGVNILAAWPFPVETAANDKTKFFNIISGTSMSTPHLSGIAALVKSVHPDWSPAAIKSAIMTTSDDVDRDGNHILDELHRNASFFAMGAGHVNPNKATNPGLVYDLGIEDYIPYLCGMGFGDSEVKAIVSRTNVSCAKAGSIKEAELNYPSIVLSSNTVTVKRTVTNVGEAKSTYKALLDGPEGWGVSVEPEVLEFSKVKETKSFTVTTTVRGAPPKDYEGNLRWVSDKHIVRSPIVISSAI